MIAGVWAGGVRASPAWTKWSWSLVSNPDHLSSGDPEVAAATGVERVDRRAKRGPAAPPGGEELPSPALVDTDHDVVTVTARAVEDGPLRRLAKHEQLLRRQRIGKVGPPGDVSRTTQIVPAYIVAQAVTGTHPRPRRGAVRPCPQVAGSLHMQPGRAAAVVLRTVPRRGWMNCSVCRFSPMLKTRWSIVVTA